MRNFFDPTDPTHIYYDPLPDHPTEEELEQYQRLTLQMMVRGIVMFLSALVILAVVSLLSGCTTTREMSSSTENRSIETVIDRMDSLFSIRSVSRQDSSWHELIMRQFESIREKSDTSRSVVLNTAGDTIRERIIINNVRETTSESDRHEREVLMQRIEKMDSTINLMRRQLSHSDSLLQARDTVVEKEVPAKLSWWQRIRQQLSDLLIFVVVVGGLILYLRRKVLGRWG